MNKNKTAKVSAAIRELRVFLDFDQEYFGKKIGVTQPMVSYYEDEENERIPGRRTKRKILAFAQRKEYPEYQHLKESLDYPQENENGQSASNTRNK